MYEDPNVHEVAYTAVFTIATDAENEPSMRGELVERISQLAEDFGCEVEILPDVEPTTARARLEYLRGELRAERISWGEVAELQSLAEHIDPSDVELLEAAGVSEFPDEEGAAGMFFATMETEHYRFTAGGATEDEARAAIAEGFRRHLIQYGVAPEDVDTYADFNYGTGEGEGALTVAMLHEHYGISVDEIRAGECLRDGAPVPEAACPRHSA